MKTRFVCFVIRASAPFPFLHRPRQTVAKKAIKIVVDVAGKVFEFLADIVEKAVAALNWVWNKIKVRFGI